MTAQGTIGAGGGMWAAAPGPVAGPIGPYAPGMGQYNGGGDGGCGYGQCGGGYGDCGYGLCGVGHGCLLAAGGRVLCGLSQSWLLRDASVFGGVHGFKGPADRGRNGNFGIHEGVNWGLPIGGPWDTGFQIGFNAVHSNFNGSQADQQAIDTLGLPAFSASDRNQVFFTTGLFHRALCGGMQWGIAFDYLHDDYYNNVHLKQIRSETAYVFAGGLREVGYFGAYGTGGDDLILLDRTAIGLQPTDMFACFYRRHFEEGGDGRIWAGFTGKGDGLVGGEIRVPIGHRWATESSFNYLIPKQGHTPEGQVRESWGLNVRLVWYLGAPARCVDQSPYRPMLKVADNSLFMATGN